MILINTLFIENDRRGSMLLKRYFLIIICSLFLFGCVSFINENEITELSNITPLNNLNDDVSDSKDKAILPKQIDEKEENKVLEIEEQLAFEEKKQSLLETIEDYIFDDFPDPQEIRQDDAKIYYLALGDSLTRGVGDEEQKNGYTKRLAEKIEQWSEISEVVLDNRGKRGRRSDQLLALIEKGHYDNELKNAQLITITIGGNDIMKIVKKDLFDLKKKDFDAELVDFKVRYDKIMKEIRSKNPDVPVILIGLYNPFSVVTDEITQFESIISEWNGTIEEISESNPKACFVDVEDLFDTNANLVYHTDFFHPNGYGYTIMTERIVSIMKNCNIEDPSNGLILFH